MLITFAKLYEIGPLLTKLEEKCDEYKSLKEDSDAYDMALAKDPYDTAARSAKRKIVSELRYLKNEISELKYKIARQAALNKEQSEFKEDHSIISHPRNWVQDKWRGSILKSEKGLDLEAGAGVGTEKEKYNNLKKKLKGSNLIKDIEDMTEGIDDDSDMTKYEKIKSGSYAVIIDEDGNYLTKDGELSDDLGEALFFKNSDRASTYMKNKRLNTSLYDVTIISDDESKLLNPANLYSSSIKTNAKTKELMNKSWYVIAIDEDGYLSVNPGKITTDISDAQAFINKSVAENLANSLEKKNDRVAEVVAITSSSIKQQISLNNLNTSKDEIDITRSKWDKKLKADEKAAKAAEADKALKNDQHFGIVARQVKKDSDGKVTDIEKVTYYVTKTDKNPGYEIKKNPGTEIMWFDTAEDADNYIKFDLESNDNFQFKVVDITKFNKTLKLRCKGKASSEDIGLDVAEDSSWTSSGTQHDNSKSWSGSNSNRSNNSWSGSGFTTRNVDSKFLKSYLSVSN